MIQQKLSPDFSLVVDPSTLLRLPDIGDAALWYALIDKNRDFLKRYVGWVDATTQLEDTELFLRTRLKSSLALESLTLAIWYREQLVGSIGFHQFVHLNRSTSISYWMDEAYQGKGIMTKSLDRLICYAFRELGLHRLELRCAVHNVQSRKVPERLGFTQEAILKEAICLYGTYYDAYQFAKINTCHTAN